MLRRSATLRAARLSVSVMGLCGAAWAQDNRKPVIDEGPSALPAPAFAGDSVTFSVRATDPDGGELAYSWNFGDGSPATAYAKAPSAGHRFASPGRYAVTVRVRDSVSAVTGTLLVPVHLKAAAGKPASSSPIVVDAAQGRVYAVNPDHGTFSAFDADALELLWEHPCGADPRSLALAPDGSVWVSNRGNATVTVHDPGDGRPLATVKLPYGSRPHGLLFRPDGAFAYVALEGSGKLARLDPAGRALSGLLELGPTPRALAITPDGSRLLVTRFLSPREHAEVYEVDAARFTAVKTWVLARDLSPDSETGGSGVPNYLAGIAIAPHGREALVVAKKDNTARGRSLNGTDLTFENTVRTTLLRLDLEEDAEAPEARGDVDNAALPSAVAYSPLGDLYFIALQGSNRFEVHDPYNRGAVLERNPGTGAAPLGLALDAARGRLFTLDFLGRTVSAFDVNDVLASKAFVSRRLKAMPAVGREALAPEVLAGKRHFYDASDSAMSRHGYLSCAACHLDGGTDGRVWDFSDRGEGLRRTTSLLGRAGMGHGPVHWSANFDEIQDFEHDLRGPFGGTGFMDEAAFAFGARNRTLGDRKAGASARLDALAAYVSSLTRVNASPFRAEGGAMTAEALRGKAVFEREEVGCARCHAGAAFTDSRLPTPGDPVNPGPVTVFAGAASWRTAEGFLLHDVGTLKASSGKRLGDTLRGIDTPTLKGIWETGPYLHDGSAATLMDVITTANPADRHGKTSQLNGSEKADLVAYLRQLDDGAEPFVAGIRGSGPAGRRLAGLRVDWTRAGGGDVEIRVAGVTSGFPQVEVADAAGRRVKTFSREEGRRRADGSWAMGFVAPKAGVYQVRAEAGGRKTAILLPWLR